jgi:response regulator of citrate/malate metabolism
MIENNNILLISEDENATELILNKLVLLRDNDKITKCNCKETKKALQNSLYCVVLLYADIKEQELIFKTIKTIKETKPDSEIILIPNDINTELILKAYDAGIYDYVPIDAESFDFVIKTINCYKLRTLKNIEQRNEKFLYQQGVIDEKTNLYKCNYLKDIFIDIADDLRIQNGIFSILTLNEKNKTKISTNRLAGIIKTTVRGDDIIATARGGKFYLILPNIDLEGTKKLIQKIQDKMGEEFKIHAGMSKIGIQSFETLDKITQDSLKSAIQNDEMTVSLSEVTGMQNGWLEDEDQPRHKDFKLFKVAFTNKMKNVIEPIFFRFQKECETKLTNTQVSQYANNIESVFSLKNETLHSELVIRFNGYAKFKIEINHSGLDSAENTKLEIPLSQLTDKELCERFSDED